MSGLPLDEPLYHGERRGVNPASFSPKNGLFSPSSPFLPTNLRLASFRIHHKNTSQRTSP